MDVGVGTETLITGGTSLESADGDWCQVDTSEVDDCG